MKTISDLFGEKFECKTWGEAMSALLREEFGDNTTISQEGSSFSLVDILACGNENPLHRTGFGEGDQIRCTYYAVTIYANGEAYDADLIRECRTMANLSGRTLVPETNIFLRPFRGYRKDTHATSPPSPHTKRLREKAVEAGYTADDPHRQYALLTAAICTYRASN